MSDDPLPLPDAGATGASHPVSLSAAQAEEGRRAYFDFTVAACAAAGVDPDFNTTNLDEAAVVAALQRQPIGWLDFNNNNGC
jgi:hypothetical protein